VDPNWIGMALSLSLVGVILGMILGVFVTTFSSSTRNVFQLYLLAIGVCALVGFSIVLPIFEHLVLQDGSAAEIAGNILVACFIVLCVGLTAIFYARS